jgi:plastocyanin
MIGRTLAVMTMAAVLLSACGGGGGAGGGTTTSTTSDTQGTTPDAQGSPVELEVEAEDFAFDRDTYTVPADSAVELKFKSRDEGVPHTFTIYESQEAQQEIFGTGNVVGDSEKDFQFQAPAAGTYYFQCDVHPEMNGDFVSE